MPNMRTVVINSFSEIFFAELDRIHDCTFRVGILSFELVSCMVLAKCKGQTTAIWLSTVYTSTQTIRDATVVTRKIVLRWCQGLSVGRDVVDFWYCCKLFWCCWCNARHASVQPGTPFPLTVAKGTSGTGDDTSPISTALRRSFSKPALSICKQEGTCVRFL